MDSSLLFTNEKNMVDGPCFVFAGKPGIGGKLGVLSPQAALIL
jgi:hypothetical protein